MEKNVKAISIIGLAGLGLGLAWYWSKVEKTQILDTSPSINYPDHVKEELFSRVKTFFGEDGFNSLHGSFVVVVGLGGVGSHCATMLVRSGVSRIRLIDFDQVTLSSLNRHSVASMADVGISKAEAMYKRLKSIVPWCEIEAITEMFKMEEAYKLLEGKPDYVLDCIDDLNTKAELIAYCVKNGIKVLTSMGAGGKADPTRIRISSLVDCINDPLASKIKWKLKKFHNVTAEEVMTVFSIEKPICNLLPLEDEQKQAPQDYGSIDYLRLRVMPVLGTSPSIFGQAMAAYTLSDLAGKQFNPEVGERMSHNLKHKVKQVLTKNEKKYFGTDKEVNIDDDDIEFIVQQIWRGRCAITNRRFGGHIILTLTRWDPVLPPVPYNLVLMMQSDAEKLRTQGKSVFPVEIIEKVEERLKWAKNICENSWERVDYGLGNLSFSDDNRKIKLLRNQGTLGIKEIFFSSMLVLLGYGISYINF